MLVVFWFMKFLEWIIWVLFLVMVVYDVVVVLMLRGFFNLFVELVIEWDEDILVFIYEV